MNVLDRLWDRLLRAVGGGVSCPVPEPAPATGTLLGIVAITVNGVPYVAEVRAGAAEIVFRRPTAHGPRQAGPGPLAATWPLWERAGARQ